MARPVKTGLDYFPLDVDIFSDEKVEFITAKFGLAGEAIMTRLLARIYRNGYYMKWVNDSFLLFASKIKHPEIESLIEEVVNELLKRDFFNQGLYDKYEILTGHGIQKRYIKACQDSKRKNFQIDINYDLTGINSELTPINPELTPINSEFSTQSKVKESKEKKSKVKQSKDYSISNSLPEEKELIPIDFENDFEVRTKIRKTLTEFCIEPTYNEVSAFVTIIFQEYENESNPLKVYVVFLKCCKEFKGFEQKNRTFAYLSSRIQGKVRDGFTHSREAAAAAEKRIEKQECADMVKNNGGKGSLDDLTHIMAAMDAKNDSS